MVYRGSNNKGYSKIQYEPGRSVRGGGVSVIIHVMSDGSRLKSINNHIVKLDEAKEFYDQLRKRGFNCESEKICYRRRRIEPENQTGN